MRLALVAVVLFLFSFSCAEKILGNRAAYPSEWAKSEQRAPSNAPVKFLIALKQSNLDKLEKLFNQVSDPDSPLYQNYFSIEEIEKIVAPSPQHAEKVLSWLRAHGVLKVVLHNDYIEVETIVRVAERVFSTHFHTFTHTESAATIVRQWGPFSIPDEIAEGVELVLGLSDFPISRASFAKKKYGVRQGQQVVVPQTVFSMYKSPSTDSVSRKGSQGVIEFSGQSFDPSELEGFAQQVGLKITPPTQAHIVGPNDPTSPQIEATLDIEYVAAVGLGIDNWFWLEDYNIWLYGWAKHFFSTSAVPFVVSISYGWNEEMQCEDGIGAQECQQLGVDAVGYVKLVNTEFQKIALRGVSILTASGDSGANGRTDPDCSENHLNPVFPAASPYVTSVGATEVTNAQTSLVNPPPACQNQGYSCISAGTERCVSFDQSSFASGGGFSDVALSQSWQKAAISTYLASGVPLPPKGYYNTSGRGFPDVAAFGSAVLIDAGGLEPVGGTSASSPMFAGIIALLNDFWITKTGKPLGFLNPLLYKMAQAHPAAFNDITVGDNKCTEDGCSSSCTGFVATRGWDPVSGLGTPVYPEMLKYLQTMAQKRGF